MMQLIRKQELLREYEVEGSFYNVDIQGEVFECRSQARIKRIGANDDNLNAIFILINPGGCLPTDKFYSIPVLDPRKTTVPFVKAESDQTQWQLMRLMKLKNWHQIVIINLSDFHSGDMTKFKQNLKKTQNLSATHHSILSKERETELRSLLAQNKGPVIPGWGTDSIIKNLAIETLQNKNITNIKGWKHKDHPYFYHPYQRIKERMIDWLIKTDELTGNLG